MSSEGDNKILKDLLNKEDDDESSVHGGSGLGGRNMPSLPLHQVHHQDRPNSSSTPRDDMLRSVGTK